MVDILEKKKYKKLVYSKPVLLVLIIVLLFVGRATWSMFEKARETENKLAAVEQEHAEVKERYDTLSEKVEDLQTERGKEEAIREKFGVAREGEHVIYLIEEEEEPAQTEKQDRSLFQKILHFVGIR